MSGEGRVQTENVAKKSASVLSVSKIADGKNENFKFNKKVKDTRYTSSLFHSRAKNKESCPQQIFSFPPCFALYNL